MPHCTPYRQDPDLGEDKGGLLGPKKDNFKVCSLLDKATPIFGSRQLKTVNSARLLDIKTEVRCGTRRYGLSQLFTHLKVCTFP